MQPDNDDELLARLALTFIDGIGPKLGRILLSHFGSARAVLNALPRELKHVGGMGEIRARAVKNPLIRERAEKELLFVRKEQAEILFLTDEQYPERLKDCDDAPLLLYYKGSVSLQADKVIAVIGTRKNTEYGMRVTEDLIEGLQGLAGVQVISGLAYGIDAIAHRKCLRTGIPTVGVVGHGLDIIYPAAHKSLAKEMVAAGGVLTEFPSGTGPDRTHFPVRNRVVAGLSDVTVIVESEEKGGAMITAYLAAGYNREVAAFPGRAYDARSGGPNRLIRRNIAGLITSAADLLEMMNWTAAGHSKGVQPDLFQELTAEEQLVVTVLKGTDGVHTDQLAAATGLAPGKLPAILLQLEMMNCIKTLPGKIYRLQ